MAKVNVVLVALNKTSLKSVIEKLNFDNANLVAIVTDSYKEKTFKFGEAQIPFSTFDQINKLAEKYKKAFWLIGDYLNDVDDLRKVKKFLATCGVPESNIVNFEVLSQISETWFANLCHVEKQGADFFATGNEYIRDNLNLKFIPRVCAEKESLGGANLSDAKQNLYQSYLTAKHVFEHVKRGKIKFVLIGLSPESFLCEDAEIFFDVQPLLSLAKITAQLDLNFDAIKETLPSTFSAKAIADWLDDKNFSEADANFYSCNKKDLDFYFLTSSLAGFEEDKKFLTVEKNISLLKDYIKLCLDNGAQPVGVIFPVTQAVRKNYHEQFLSNFREIIHRLEKENDFLCVDMFDLNLDYDCFCDMTHLNVKGMRRANALLSAKLCDFKLLPLENFCDMTYEYFSALSNVADKNYYQSMVSRVFKISAQKIRAKDKVKLGFVIRGDIAEWCGDDLYNLFANDERFETTVFFSLRTDKAKNELVKAEFLRGVEQIKSHGLKVFVADEINTKVPAQDVLIFLSPYLAQMAYAFRLENLKASTLITHITYSFMMSIRSNDFYNRKLFRTAWKVFFSSPIVRDLFDSKNPVGMPRGVYSGYPRTDIFFKKDVTFTFNWKMVQPAAKKIIWAPHWSINAVTKYATFQWNYRFMYEFAKAHPEISWVVKPHPALFFSAVSEKVFPTLEAFKKYLQKWDDLPNAQVYTGGYYQAVFATSDGMIHDSSSFIAEYQFVDKPMIFLTREKEVFNELGATILKGAYLVSGKNLEAIAATIQKVFIDGNDYKAAERKAIFDKYLNYPKLNGMPASEFIYKSIADELKGES